MSIHTYMCAGTLAGQQRDSYLLNLQLQAVLSCAMWMDAGNQTPGWKSSKCSQPASHHVGHSSTALKSAPAMVTAPRLFPNHILHSLFNATASMMGWGVHLLKTAITDEVLSRCLEYTHWRLSAPSSKDINFLMSTKTTKWMECSNDKMSAFT